MKEEKALQTLMDLYESRPDLQDAFPEVLSGELQRLINWAAGVTSYRWVDSAADKLQPYKDWFLAHERPVVPPVDSLRLEISKKYLRGIGVDIGPLSNPFVVVNENCQSIRIDIYPKEKLIKLYPELMPQIITKPEVLCDGETLNAFRPSSFDFITASHLLEHLRNPIGAIEKWIHTLKRGGYLVIIIPEKNFTFDKHRPVTQIAHFLDDYKSNTKQKDYFHYLEWAELKEKRIASEIPIYAKKLMNEGYPIHRHVFDESSWNAFLNLIIERLKFPIGIVESQFCRERGEVFTVLKKGGFGSIQS